MLPLREIVDEWLTNMLCYCLLEGNFQEAGPDRPRSLRSGLG